MNVPTDVAGLQSLFRCDTETRGANRVVTVAGELDLATAPQLRLALDAAFADSAGGLVVEMAEVTFVDSSGLHVLADAGAHATATRRGYVVGRPDPEVCRVFKRSGLRDIVPASWM